MLTTDGDARYLRCAQGGSHAHTAGGGQGDEEAEEEGLGPAA